VRLADGLGTGGTQDQGRGCGIPGGYVVKDANGQPLAYVYARESKADADTAKVLTMGKSSPRGLQHRKAAGAVAHPAVSRAAHPLSTFHPPRSLPPLLVVSHRV
jgi:hypothetical protein